MFYLFCAFAAGWYLNSIESRQVACTLPSVLADGQYQYSPPDQQYHIIDRNALPQSQNWQGLFGATEDINSPQVAQFPPVGPGANPNVVGRSRIQTIVKIKPLVAFQNVGTLLPLGNVPGLGQPFTFTYTNEIEQEEPGP